MTMALFEASQDSCKPYLQQLTNFKELQKKRIEKYALYRVKDMEWVVVWCGDY